MRSGLSRALLLPGLVLVACAVWSVDPVLESPTQARGRAAAWYEQALTEVNAGQTSAAYLSLKNVLRQDPFSLAAHMLLARVYIQLGQGGQAEKELLIADGLGAHQSLTLIPRARSYLLQGNAEKLLGALFPLGNLADEDAELLALRGQAHVQLGQLYDAQRAFDQAGERDPTNVSAMLGRVHVLMLQGDLNAASGDARRAVALAPDNPRAWLLRGMLLRGRSEVPAALRDFERAVAVLPAYLPAQMARISALLELDRFDQALAAAEESLTLYPRDPRSSYLKAVVHACRHDVDSAQAALRQTEALISQLPRELIDAHPPTLLLAGMVNFSLKQWTQAISYLAPFLDQFPDTVGPRILLARIALDRQQNDRAIRLLEPALSLAPGDQQVLSLLAEAFMRDGQHVKAALFLQQALEAGDDNLVLRTQRAVNQFGLGRKAQAIEELGAVVEADPQYAEASATLVVTSLKEQRFEEAVKVAAQLLEGNPGNITYLNLYGVAQLAAGDRAAARWAFDLAVALDWRFVPAQLNLAELDLRENRPHAARDRLQVVLARNPDQLSALLLLARTVEQLGLPEQARQLAERAVSADPTAVPVAVYLTDLLLKMQQTEAALTVVQSAEVRGADPEDLALLVALSRAYLANGHRATAQVVLQRGSSLAGYNAGGLLELALLQRQAGDRNGALWSLEKAVAGQPRYLPTRIKLGELYAEVGKLDQAETLATALRKDFPQEPYGEHLLGTIARARGDDARALEHFKRALKQRESPILAVRTYETLRVAQGVGPATDFLRRWVEKHPDDAVARQALAEGLFRAGRVTEAKAIYQHALLRTPDNAVLLNNLALIYAQEGDAQGIALARKAQVLLPVPEITDTLGWVLVRAGQLADGLSYLRDAQSRAAAEPGISYHIAYALVRMGRDEDALRELTRLFRKEADFPEREAADQLRREVQARLGRGTGARDAGLDPVVE